MGETRDGFVVNQEGMEVRLLIISGAEMLLNIIFRV